MTSTRQLLTTEQAAEYMQVHLETVRQLLRKGELPGFKLLGLWRIDLAELNAWIERQKTNES